MSGLAGDRTEEYMTWQGQPSATVDLVLGDYAVIERYMRQRFHEALVLACEDGWELIHVIDAAEDVSTLFFKRPKVEG